MMPISLSDDKPNSRFGAVIRSGGVTKIEVGRPFKLHTYDEVIESEAIIVATGAQPRKLGLPSEEKYWAKGVTSCATCDGYFYKYLVPFPYYLILCNTDPSRGKEVCVIGGGDSAMEEATFLTNYCPKGTHIRNNHYSY